MAALDHFRVAILATDGVEEVELTEPAKALGQASAKTDVISLQPGRIQAFRHTDKNNQIPVDLVIDQADPANYDALLLPGGTVNADRMRMQPRVQQFIRAMANANKPMAVICHAPWELISAGLARGRTLTSWPTLQDDLRNAGANWVDQEVVIDGNLITSRGPQDIPSFNREMIRLFTRSTQAAMP
ncbi:MAG TPA: type 1 glutamine amidotransferase domain-containing protein [Ktedonobacterales bacterium]|nr:type 1 glutamine amidotransferase domain-containing protein [Ktedonobacterales bacterium]